MYLFAFLELWKSHHGEGGLHEVPTLSIHIESSVSREERLLFHPYKQIVGETNINTVHACDWIILITKLYLFKIISPSMYRLNNNNISATIYYQHYLNNILK